MLAARLFQHPGRASALLAPSAGSPCTSASPLEPCLRSCSTLGPKCTDPSTFLSSGESSEVVKRSISHVNATVSSGRMRTDDPAKRSVARNRTTWSATWVRVVSRHKRRPGRTHALADRGLRCAPRSRRVFRAAGHELRGGRLTRGRVCSRGLAARRAEANPTQSHAPSSDPAPESAATPIAHPNGSNHMPPAAIEDGRTCQAPR
jgi:hypothetical protein